MFWSSVLGGLKVFLFWETYVVGLEYVLITYLPLYLYASRKKPDESGAPAGGCFLLLGMPGLQVFATTVCLLTLSPIILGVSGDVQWSFPWRMMLAGPGVFLLLVIGIFILSVIFALVPLLGQSQGVLTLLQGGIILNIVGGIFRSMNSETAALPLSVWPGFWFTVGLLVVSAVASKIGIIVGVLLATAVTRGEEAPTQLLALPLGALFGFLPAFMYGAWLGHPFVDAGWRLG